MNHYYQPPHTQMLRAWGCTSAAYQPASPGQPNAVPNRKRPAPSAHPPWLGGCRTSTTHSERQLPQEANTLGQSPLLPPLPPPSPSLPASAPAPASLQRAHLTTPSCRPSYRCTTARLALVVPPAVLLAPILPRSVSATVQSLEAVSRRPPRSCSEKMPPAARVGGGGQEWDQFKRASPGQAGVEGLLLEGAVGGRSMGMGRVGWWAGGGWGQPAGAQNYITLSVHATPPFLSYCVRSARCAARFPK